MRTPVPPHCLVQELDLAEQKSRNRTCFFSENSVYRQTWDGTRKRALCGCGSGCSPCFDAVQSSPIVVHSRCLVLFALAGCLPANFCVPTEVPLLLYVFVMVPYRTSFELEVEFGTAEFFVELMVDIYFVVDIVMNFRTGRRD